MDPETVHHDSTTTARAHQFEATGVFIVNPVERHATLYY
jgi:hypothetical protein